MAELKEVDAIPARVCLICNEHEVLCAGENIWPANWTCVHCGRFVPALNGFPSYAPALADKLHGFDPADFEELASFEREHFWFAARGKLIGYLVDRHFPNAKCLLEVGCGTGIVLELLNKQRTWERIAGSELHPKGLTIAARRLPNVELVQMDARQIPAASVFDVIGAFDVLEHIEEDETVLAAMHRALATKGGVIVAVPQHPFLWSNVDEAAHHVRRYRRGELETKMRRVGFRVVFSSSYNAILMPALVASRFAASMRSRNGMEKLPTKLETHVPATLNHVFKAALNAEVMLTQRGLRWPIGGSRIVVAVRADN